MGIFTRQVLGGPHKTEPSTTNPTKKWRDQQEKEPDQDNEADHTPIDGVPNEAEIKDPEEGGCKQ